MQAENNVLWLCGFSLEGRDRFADACENWRLAAQAYAAKNTTSGNAYADRAIELYRSVWRIESGPRQSGHPAPSGTPSAA